MIYEKKTLLSIAIAAALALTACGGDPSPVAPTSSSGQAVDGYLIGSQALCDSNANGVFDTGESVVTTIANGAFTFTPACASTVVVSGGTNADTNLPFKGLLKAPAGSAFATPLTSLMVAGGLTAAQVATAFGLPAGTDVSKVDPVAAGNETLLKKTLAAQQIMQQVADTLGGLAGNTTPVAIQALYSEVAKAVASTILANVATLTPLVAGTTVNPTLVASIVGAAVTNVSASTSPALSVVKLVFGNDSTDFTPTSIAELTSAAIVIQAQALTSATGSVADLIALTTTLQSNPTIANTAAALSSLLTVAVAGAVNLTDAGAALVQLADAVTNNDDTAVTAVNIAVVTQATAATIIAPVIYSTISAPSNYLAITNDQIIFGIGSESQTNTLTEFVSSSGVTLTAQPDTIGFAYTLAGTPIPAVGGSVVSVGIEITQASTQASTGRVLQVVLDQVNLAVSSGVLTATVPAGAELYAYGKTSTGATATVTLRNLAANTLITSSGSALTFNVMDIVNSIIANFDANSAEHALFARVLDVKGSFSLTAVVSNLAIQSGISGAVASRTVAVTGSAQSVTGLGVQGKFTVQ